MIDLKKVIKGLEQFIKDFKPFCGNKADWQRVYDALALLKAQEPRVLALDEIHGSIAVWLEDVDKADVILAITESEFYALHGLCRCFITSDNRRIAPLKREYGIRWRAWTSRPDEKRREETPWE